MAMNIGSADPNAEPDVMVEMNTTPLIDVMLVLLVMLIITIPIQLHSVNMSMATNAPQTKPIEPVIIRLEVTSANEIVWDGEVIANRKIVEEKMKIAAALSEQPEVHLKPDAKAKYETVAYLLAASNRAGLLKLGIVGSEQFAR